MKPRHFAPHSCSAREKRTLFFLQKVRELYYVNALYVFLGSNLSFNWQSHDKILYFEIES